MLLSFPRSAWERKILPLCGTPNDAERRDIPFPRRAWERGIEAGSLELSRRWLSRLTFLGE